MVLTYADTFLFEATEKLLPNFANGLSDWCRHYTKVPILINPAMVIVEKVSILVIGCIPPPLVILSEDHILSDKRTLTVLPSYPLPVDILL